MECLPVASKMIENVLSKAVGNFIVHLAYPFEVHNNIDKLNEVATRLRARRDNIVVQINLAKSRKKVCKNEVMAWLEAVNIRAVEVEATNDAYQNRRSGCVLFSNNIVLAYKTSKRAAMMLKELNELYERGSFEEIVVEMLQPSIIEFPTTSNVLSVKSTLESILLYLTSESIGIIGVWGMGGVGKTILLKMINNHFLDLTGKFDHVICVTAGRGCIIEELQMAIIDKVGLQLKKDATRERNALAIFNYLKEKMFMLLLDDIWDHVDLESVGIPHPDGQKNQKIVLAARSEEICGKMKAQTRIKLECLGPNEAWELFKDTVSLETISADPRIESIARKVCTRCGGLPLALVTTGRAMSTCKAWQEWMNALVWFQDAQHSDISSMDNADSLLSTLRFSYDKLNDRLKDCFLSCLLWPEGYSIVTYKLVECWIGLGLLTVRQTYEAACNEGYSCIEQLKKVCLLESGDFEGTEVRLHNVVREMALQVVSVDAPKKGNWIVQAGHRLKGLRMDDRGIWEAARSISAMCNFIVSLPNGLNCPTLEVLILQQNFQLDSVPQNFFAGMRSLKYLDLSWTQIKELPTSISTLVNLEYANLSRTDLISIPREFGDLQKLRMLDLNYTDHLKNIPYGVISKMSSLQVLNLFQSMYSAFEMEESRHGESFTLQELQGFECAGLRALGLTVATSNALQLLSKLDGICLFLLGLKVFEGVSSILLKMQSGVQVLNINRCQHLEELTILTTQSEFSNISLPRLEHLTLFRLPRLKKFRMEEKFPFLRRLVIAESNSLTDISCIVNFPHLEVLDLSFCSNLQYVVCAKEDDGDVTTENHDGIALAFLRLRTIQMMHLPKMEKFSHCELTFPSLQYMDVFGCPLFTVLPFQSIAKMSSLRRIRGDEEWWRRLQWNDARSCAEISPFFKIFENSMETFSPDLNASPFMSSRSSFFARREPMIRPALFVSSYLSQFFGSQLS